MPHELMKLPYALNALEPHISKETLQYHHGKHHRAYVEKLNELVIGTEFEHSSLEDTVRKSSGDIFNNAAQVWNHNFYWQCLTPDGEGLPNGALAKAIDSAFGSFEGFSEKFTKAAIARFGSGWAWLVRKSDSTLAIVTTGNADNPLKSGEAALLTCDVWEHAYYIDYRNKRPDYLKAFWGLVNWDFAEERYHDAPDITAVKPKAGLSASA